MNLKKYIQKTGINISSLAKEAGISIMYLWEIIEEKKRPSPKVAHKISDVCRGKVTALDIIKPFYKKRPLD